MISLNLTASDEQEEIIKNNLHENIPKLTEPSTKMMLRVIAEGEPVQTTYEFNCMTYKAIKVGDKVYIPDNTKI